MTTPNTSPEPQGYMKYRFSSPRVADLTKGNFGFDLYREGDVLRVRKDVRRVLDHVNVHDTYGQQGAEIVYNIPPHEFDEKKIYTRVYHAGWHDGITEHPDEHEIKRFKGQPVEVRLLFGSGQWIFIVDLWNGGSDRENKVRLCGGNPSALRAQAERELGLPLGYFGLIAGDRAWKAENRKEESGGGKTPQEFIV